MTKAFMLSEQDHTELIELLRQHRTRISNYPGRGRHDEGDQYTPDIYVCLTPVSGVPSAVDPELDSTGTGTGTGPATDKVRPGTANCQVFRILPDWEGNLALFPSTVGSVPVYNLANRDVGGSQWIVVARDKHGDWYIVSGTSSETTWLRVLCALASSQSGYYPALDQTFDVVTQKYKDTEGTFSKVTSGSFVSGTQTVSVDSLNGIVVGGTYIILDGFCDCESFVAIDPTGTGTGTDMDVSGNFTNDYIVNGVQAVDITFGGLNYQDSPPDVTITDGNGNTSASAFAVLDASGDHVISVGITAPGKDYDPATTVVTFTPPAGTASGTPGHETATGTVVLSGPVRIYLAAVWAAFNPPEYTPVDNDVTEPVIFFARKEAAFTDGIPVRVALGGETFNVVCASGRTYTMYTGRIVKHT